MTITRRFAKLGILAAAAGLGATANAASLADRCAAIAAHRFASAEIVSTVLEPPQAYHPAGAARPVALPSYCAVRAISRPSRDSGITIEIWLPVPASWNGRIQAVGTGGYRGEIGYDALARALAAGYAAVGTDSGHSTPPGQAPESLAFGDNHPDRIADWAGRSVHAAMVVARPVVTAFEGKAADYSYFVSCSTGGQQGLMAMERYPDDFDGILIGAPGNNRTGLNAGFLWRFAVNNVGEVPTLPASKLQFVGQAVIAACDQLDGVKDGVINDPDTCNFRPESLACDKDQDGSDCLTPAQVRVLAKLEEDARDPITGSFIYPAWPKGSEAGWGGYIAGNEPVRLGFWRGWVFEQPDWSWRDISWGRDLATARSRVGKLTDATSGNVKAFSSRGGKLIIYQGWADPVGNSADTIATFRGIAQHNSGFEQFVRLYMIPGMGHCAGGPGADQFDLLAPLQQWVERNEMPRQIVAAHIENGAVLRRRPLCAYPAKLRYRGSGDPNAAENFECSATDRPL